VGRLVVYSGGGDGAELPPALPVAGRWIGGGIRTLHELAFAAAASGRRVELRGPVLPAAVERLAAATGVRPELPREPRRPDAHDVVVLPEGYDEPWWAGRVVLSRARAAMLLLAPPGLFGWPFTRDWEKPSPLVAERAALARPEHFRAYAELGFALWTPMPRMAELAAAAGVPCRAIGNGTPGPAPAPAEKRHDVAWLRANRWAPLAEQVAAALGEGVTVDAIEEAEHEQLLDRLAAARVLLWPSRIEGHARIVAEARARGCVPVALASNEFATGLDEASGAVVVAALERMAPVVADLLRDPDRLASLAEHGRRSAAEQLDWGGYVARVGAALDELEAREPAGTGALAELGERLAALELERARLLAWTQRELALTRADRERWIARHAGLEARRSVRLALRLAQLRPGRRAPR